MKLPRDVHVMTNRHGCTYYYYTPGRGTKNPGGRVALGSDINDPEFWRKLRDAKGGAQTAREGTFSELIANWGKHNWDRLRPATRRSFDHFLNQLDAEAGDRLVTALTTPDIYQLLDGMSDTPNSANFMLSVLRILLKWGVKRGYRSDNPAVGVERLKVEDSGHEPWPEHGYNFVIEQAPTHLQRMAYLGRATGQRVSDLVKMRPADLADDGIILRIGKLRDRKHFVPLNVEQMATIKSWGVFLCHHARDRPAMLGKLPQRPVEQLARFADSGAVAGSTASSIEADPDYGWRRRDDHDVSQRNG